MAFSVLSAPSQVLMRNRSIFEQGKWLLVNPSDSQIFAELSDCELDGFHQYYPIYQSCIGLSTGYSHEFAAACPAQANYDGVVIYLAKSKQHNAMLLQNISCCIKSGGQLLLVGENKAGIKSVGKMLQQFGKPQKVDSARHCALFAVGIEKPRQDFELKDWCQTLNIQIDDIRYPIVTLPGVFSFEHLDPGTELLLRSVTNVPTGELLDFACGAGAIGCYLGLKNTKACVTMTDVNALALYCAQQSAKMNKINAKVLASDGLADVSGSFKAIFTNPPFHTGIHTDYSVTQRFIQDARQVLHKGASLTLVANRFLPYKDLLQAHFGSVELLADNAKFNLFYST